MDKQLRVLVVDDEAPVRRLMARALAQRGYAPFEASDGATALAMVTEAEFEVILLDYGLPDMPGTEVLQRLRARRATATTPVLLVTGRGSVPDRVEGLTAGANDYLVKPVDLEELVARVDAQVRGREAWRTEVADMLSERAALASAIASIDAPDGAEAARRVAELLVQLPELLRVSVVALASPTLVLLADTGADRAAWAERIGGPDGSGGADGQEPQPVSPSVAAELRQAVEARHRTVSPRVRDATLPGATGHVRAFGVEDRGELVAAIVVECADPVSDRHPPGAAVADLLPVIDRVLGPCVRAGRGLDAGSHDLRTLLDRRAFHPVFQPIVDLRADEVVGFEALTRFDDGSSPGLRFVQASATGLLAELEVATFGAALRAAADLPPGRYVSYNVSASLLLQGGLASVLEEGAHHPVVLEITEHERIDDYDAVRTAVAALGDGIRLSVDDAGSGWSSLRHVLSLRPDYVKLDRGWVHEIDRDPARQALLLGIGRFVEQMGGEVVAEGIESVAELDTLRNLGIPRGQGYHLGRPAPVSELSRV